MRDYYYILGITQNATEQEIKTAYRKLSMKFHPDKNSGEKFFEERFKEIQEGYEILSSQAKRREYDSRLNQFNSTRTNRDNLKNREEELKRKFEEELRKQEEELKRNYQARENRIKEEAEKKIKYESERINQTGEKKSSHSFLYILFALALGIIFYLIVNRSNKNESKSAFASISDSLSTIQVSNNDTASMLFDVNSIELIFEDNKKIKFSDYPTPDYLKEHKQSRKFNFIDLDKDDVPELIISYNTFTWFHCCTEFTVFRQVNKNEYENIFYFQGGEGGLRIEDYEIILNFYEQIGYFYSSYGSSIDDSLPNGRFEPKIVLNYSNNQVALAEKNSYLNQIIIEDLNYLRNRGIPKLDSTGVDDGTRKSYAEHIITYYFNTERNIDSTKAIFSSYYVNSDASEIWKDIQRHIDGITTTQEAGNDWQRLMDISRSASKKDSSSTTTETNFIKLICNNDKNVSVAFNNQTGKCKLKIDGKEFELEDDSMASGIRYSNSEYIYSSWHGNSTITQNGKVICECK